MTLPSAATVQAAVEATWPPARYWTDGPFTLRDGAGGGKRVSATTATGPVTAPQIARVDSPLFCIRQGEDALDTLLEQAGYRIIDPVTLYAIPVADLIDPDLPTLAAICSDTPLAILREIWQEGGIGPGRIAVMERAPSPKTYLLGRINDRPAGAAFAAISDGLAMVHAIETRPRFRRAGVARAMLRRAADWAAHHGAAHLALAVTTANEPANALYSSLGMRPVGQYHYRIRPETPT